MGPNLYFGMYFDMPAITQVINKAQRVLKFHPTDFKEGLKETYKWYLRHHQKDTSNYAFEDKLIANAPPYLPKSRSCVNRKLAPMWQIDSRVRRFVIDFSGQNYSATCKKYYADLKY